MRHKLKYGRRICMELIRDQHKSYIFYSICFVRLFYYRHRSRINTIVKWFKSFILFFLIPYFTHYLVCQTFTSCKKNFYYASLREMRHKLKCSHKAYKFHICLPWFIHRTTMKAISLFLLVLVLVATAAAPAAAEEEGRVYPTGWGPGKGPRITHRPPTPKAPRRSHRGRPPRTPWNIYMLLQNNFPE